MTWRLGLNEAGIKLWDDSFVGVTINNEIRSYRDVCLL